MISYITAARSYGHQIKLFFSIALIFIWLGGHAGAAAPEPVDVDGASVLSMEDAKNQALRAAVEQAAGVFIQSESEMENFILQKDRILARTQGYITRYEMIRQRKSGATYEVQIRAWVSTDKIHDDLVAMKILLQRMDRPKLMVLVDETLAGIDGQAGQVVDNELTTLLIQKGFELVDQQQLTAARQRDQAKQALAGNTAAAKILGLEVGAQYVLIGKAVASNAGEVYAGTGLNSIQANLQVKIIQTRTGNILDAVNATSAAAHVSPMTGAVLAFQKVSRKAVEQNLVDMITRNFQDFLNNGAPIKLHITGVSSYRVYKQVTQAVEGIERVANCKKNSWNQTGGLLVLDLLYRGNSEELADQIDGRKLAKKQLEVVDLNAERVDCRLN